MSTIDHMTHKTKGFACIPNTASTQVFEMLPWLFEEQSVPSDFKNKEALKAYANNADSSTCHYFSVIGENPKNRPTSTDNKPAWIVAIVADYDSQITDEMREQFTKKLRVPPTWVSRSYSGGTHAVWLLEEPIPVISKKSLSAIKAQACTDLSLKHAYGVLDEPGYKNHCQPTHVGWDWRNVGALVPSSLNEKWLQSSLKEADDSEGSIIPIDVIRTKVEERFPGRWLGDFEIGARGCRFWDPSADNHTAALVSEKGMVCFTGDSTFVSWGAIFGKTFVDDYNSNKFAKVIDQCYAVGEDFYMLGNKVSSKGSYLQEWLRYSAKSFEGRLHDVFGLSNTREKGEESSDVRKALEMVRTKHTVDGVAPFLYDKRRLVDREGDTFINTSKTKVLAPDTSKSTEWGVDFPWIAQFFEGIFPEELPRETFIHEFAYAYRHAYAGAPRRGRVTFISGDPGVGKNFLTEVILGPIMGGFIDASDYLVGGARFNGHLFDRGVWTLNDTVSRGTSSEKAAFSSRIKQMSANSNHVVESKFKSSVNVEWHGRIYVTMNTDPISMSILPEMGMSNEDKFSLYRVFGEPMNDPDAFDKAVSELPAFCQYLNNLVVPDHLVDTYRWGVKGYFDKTMRARAQATSSASTFRDMLATFAENYFAAMPEDTEIKGTASYLHGLLSQEPAISSQIGKMTVVSLTMNLALLSDRDEFPVKLVETEIGTSKWVIDRKGWDEYFSKM